MPGFSLTTPFVAIGWLASTLFGCTAAAPVVRRDNCVSVEAQPTRYSLKTRESVTVPDVCMPWVGAQIDRGLRLTSSPEGLVIRMTVLDASYRPGPYTSTDGPRDVVVVFPEGQRPGRPFIELRAVERESDGAGYDVDDRVEWSHWGLTRPEGRIKFILSVFNRESDGVETESRFAFDLELSVDPSSETSEMEP